ncbi:glycosyltransferase family 2 protein [Treponema denticola]|uniref:Glycosyltransferase family 2 protein n=1 Tax=Treponema denticola TaxID=158 RepID=A0A9Q9EWP4_TREDN|nr:glycosyltransferase family A protein [Treponema denticola]UTC90780.1 glycosyltransferase family 2 protein [Treponema denticola]UTC99868.1 glycosyltransferase family 2 protein [Treponema denticola]
MKNNPKYSIIIPVNNVINYLPGAIESIISQDYNNYELIISDDSSTDGTAEYVDTLSHHAIRVIHTPKRMTTAEHFDWALTHAKGEWCIFVGGDDGLQPYFFILADKLTDIATTKNIRAIASRRAYFFWNGCQAEYGDKAVVYSAEQKVYVCNSKKEALKALYEKKDYFELPQMYTTSLFHTSLIDDIRKKQGGKFLTHEISDANMAALSTVYEKQYLQCEIPIGWVGTSPKTIRLNENFADLVTKDIPKVCGDYRLGSLSLYFWSALNKVFQFYPERVTYINSEKFVKKILPYVYLRLAKNKNFIQTDKYRYFIQTLKINNLSTKDVITKAKLITLSNNIVRFAITSRSLLIKILFFPWRCIRYILKRMPLLKKYFIQKKSGVYIAVTWSEQPDMTYAKAQQIILKLIHENIHFDEIKL